MKKIITGCLILFTVTLQAQDIFQESLFSADLIIRSSRQIDLSDQQRDRIQRIHAEHAGEFNTIKWELEAVTSKMSAMLEEPKLNLDAVQKQMDEMLNLENSLKKRQFSALVAIKNELTEKQQEELKEIKGSLASKTEVNGSSGKGNGSLSLTFQSKNPKDKPLMYINTPDGLTEVKAPEKINPKYIKSITVLKDRSATEKVGKQGKNGIIIITLKDGAEIDFMK